MDELGKIKALEAEMAAELEKARKAAAARVEAAKAARKGVLDKAVRDAEKQAEKMLSESTLKAEAEARDIAARCDGDIKAIRERHSRNSRKAVDYVLKELGV